MQIGGGNNALLFNELQEVCNSVGCKCSMQNGIIIVTALLLITKIYIIFDIAITKRQKSLKIKKSENFTECGRNFHAADGL